MDEDKQKQLVEELARRTQLFAEGVTKQDEDLKETHEKKEFTFSTVEKRRLLQQESVALIVHQAIEDIINLEVLRRLDITPGIEIRVLYDTSLGRFVVWQPKEVKQDPV